MALEGVRDRLRSLAESGREATEQAGTKAKDVGQRAARRAAEDAPQRAAQTRQAGRRVARGIEKRAPATGLEGGRQPRVPRSTREAMVRRLQESGKMRKPIGDANLEPGADPRFLEAFAMGDATTGYAWFGEQESGAGRGGGDAMGEFFAGGGTPAFEFGPFVQEMLDERDHEAGHYAYDDERETGWLDDGVRPGDIMGWP